MWKKISVVAGGMAIAVALPFVALAVTTDEFSDLVTPADAAPATVQATTQAQAVAAAARVEPTGPWVSPNAVDPIAIEQADQAMVRQQLRIHAETGPPEGFEPVQQRLHADDPLGMGPGKDDTGQGNQVGNGNQHAPKAGAGIGECPSDGADCPTDGQPQGGQGMGEGQGQGHGKAPGGGRNG